MSIDELALKVGAKHYSPAPMRAVRGWSFTFEQLHEFLKQYEADQGEAFCYLSECNGGYEQEWKDFPKAFPVYLRPDPRVKELEQKHEVACQTINTLQKHRDNQIAVTAKAFGQVEELLAKVAELERQLAEARKDAERLDFIQSNARCDPMMDGKHKWWPTNFNKCLTGPTLRDAIDAAMKGIE